jgi:hypothetical protein
MMLQKRGFTTTALTIGGGDEFSETTGISP